MFVVCKCTYICISNVMWISNDGLTSALWYKWLFGKFLWIGSNTLVDFHKVFVRNLKNMEFSMSLFEYFTFFVFEDVDIVLSCDV